MKKLVTVIFRIDKENIGESLKSIGDILNHRFGITDFDYYVKSLRGERR